MVSDLALSRLFVNLTFFTSRPLRLGRSVDPVPLGPVASPARGRDHFVLVLVDLALLARPLPRRRRRHLPEDQRPPGQQAGPGGQLPGRERRDAPGPDLGSPASALVVLPLAQLVRVLPLSPDGLHPPWGRPRRQRLRPLLPGQQQPGQDVPGETYKESISDQTYILLFCPLVGHKLQLTLVKS